MVRSAEQKRSRYAEMDHFTYRAGSLHCEGVALSAIADAVATPADVYSKAAVLDTFSAYEASNYNSRPRAVEMLVDGSAYSVVRRRESYEDLVAGESIT